MAVLTENQPKDVYSQAQCMFLLKEYHRAAHTIKVHGIEKTHMPSYNLLLESLYEAKEFNEALSVINHVDADLFTSSISHRQDTNCESNDDIGRNVSSLKKSLRFFIGSLVVLGIACVNKLCKSKNI